MNYDFFGFDKRLSLAAKAAEEKAKAAFDEIDEISFYNQAKVLEAFRKNKISDAHLKGSTGYGYGDTGREALDRLYADVMGCEDALVRHGFVSGTHAISTALFGVLRPGDTLVSLTGKPYDTLEEVIGIREGSGSSLKDFGVKYKLVELKDGKPDLEGIALACREAKAVFIQRSRGYTLREPLLIEDIENIVKTVRSVNENAVVIVDNCYGEFVEKTEPSSAGADLIAGSLIKNPGGGIAETGGYIAGREKFVNLCADRLTCVGMGKEVGCTLNQNKPMIMGLFMAPSAVASALKTSAFACELFRLLGFETYPGQGEKRGDIIAAIKLGSPERLIAFCRGIQAGSPIDSHVSPEPWDMPGYDSKVIMAAGTFTMGSSIELSADAPLKEPYTVWLQGGITYGSGKLGVMWAAQSMIDAGLLNV